MNYSLLIFTWLYNSFNIYSNIEGFEDPIDGYYNKQDELLQSFYDMDDINAHGGYIPTSSQVNLLINYLKKIYIKRIIINAYHLNICIL